MGDERGRTRSMKKINWYLFFIVLWLFCGEGHGLAQTMYVTDRLYLSLRSAPDPELPALVLLPSDTKVEVLATEDKWAQVKLEDGRTGWVMKRYLVKDLPKSLVIEELKRQVENRSVILEKLEEENRSIKKGLSDRTIEGAKEDALKKRIETLKAQITRQKKNIELSTREKTVERLKEVYVTGIVALFVGLVIGYLVRKPPKKRQIFY